MRSLRSSAAALMLCIGMVCPSFRASAQIPSGVWTSPELGIKAGQSIAGALETPFEVPFEVTLSAPVKGTAKTLRNCKDYLPVARTIYSAGPAVVANVLRAEGARCDALDLLRSARPAERHPFAEFSFIRLSAKDLPSGLALLVNNEQRKVAREFAEHGGSVADLEKRVVLKAKSGNEAELSTRDWTATLTVLARADFLSDGGEELLLLWNAAAVSGTLRTSRVFLLARQQGAGPLRIVRERP